MNYQNSYGILQMKQAAGRKSISVAEKSQQYFRYIRVSIFYAFFKSG